MMKSGTMVFIRTVTYHYCGYIVREEGGFLVLGGASWVADSGPFHQALLDGEFKEAEAFPKNVYINMSTIVDMTKLDHIP